MSTASAFAVTFFIGLAVLGWGIDRAGIAAPYSDPIAHIRAQDEAVYVNSAIRMVQDGDWLTPKVMGRLFLFKPPLLMWMAALSIRLLGLSLIAVRLPSLILGAAGAAAVYAWTARARSPAAGLLGAGLLLLSPFWQTLARLCYTDLPASAFVILALAPVAFDPRVERRRTAVACGVLGAAAILTKSVAGLIPFAVLGLYWLIMPRPRKPGFANLALVILAAAVVLAPWHIYQMLVHGRWFWADYVQVQLLGIGLTAARNGVFDRPVLFYLERLIRMDPAPALLAAAALPGAVRVARSREEPAAVLAVCWTVVTVLALSAFQARNLPYLAFLIPAFCVLGAVCGPRFLDRRMAVATSLVGVLFVAKAVASGAPWSLQTASPPIEGAAAMRLYYGLNREAELIVCAPDDEFYSSVIPLPRVRYCFDDPTGQVGRTIPHYPYLGIVITSDEFVALPALMPRFAARLREWGLNSTEPVGTSIPLPTPAGLISILRARPDVDAYLPAGWTSVIQAAAASHQVRPYSDSRVFLLSRTGRSRPGPIPPIPARW